MSAQRRQGDEMDSAPLTLGDERDCVPLTWGDVRDSVRLTREMKGIASHLQGET